MGGLEPGPPAAAWWARAEASPEEKNPGGNPVGAMGGKREGGIIP